MFGRVAITRLVWANTLLKSTIKKLKQYLCRVFSRLFIFQIGETGILSVNKLEIIYEQEIRNELLFPLSMEWENY